LFPEARLISIEATPLATTTPLTVTFALGSCEVGVNFIFEVEKGTVTAYAYCVGKKVGVKSESGVKLKKSRAAFVDGFCLVIVTVFVFFVVPSSAVTTT
jgi:hypothetical protein